MVLYRFDLTACPDRKFELPREVEAYSLKISSSLLSDCNRSPKYLLQKSNQAAGAKGASKLLEQRLSYPDIRPEHDDGIHAQLHRGKSCAIEVVYPAVSNNEQLTEYRASIFADTLLFGSGVSLKFSSVRRHALDSKALRKWCGSGKWWDGVPIDPE